MLSTACWANITTAIMVTTIGLAGWRPLADTHLVTQQTLATSDCQHTKGIAEAKWLCWMVFDGPAEALPPPPSSARAGPIP